MDDLQERVKTSFEKRYYGDGSSLNRVLAFPLRGLCQNMSAAYNPEQFLDGIIEGVIVDESERTKARSYAAGFFCEGTGKRGKWPVIATAAYAGVIISLGCLLVVTGKSTSYFGKIYEGDLNKNWILPMACFSIWGALLFFQTERFCLYAAARRVKQYVAE